MVFTLIHTSVNTNVNQFSVFFVLTGLIHKVLYYIPYLKVHCALTEKYKKHTYYNKPLSAIVCLSQVILSRMTDCTIVVI